MANLSGFLLLVSIIGLIIGLIDPTIFVYLFKREITRKKIGLIFGVTILIFFLLITLTADSSKEIFNKGMLKSIDLDTMIDMSDTEMTGVIDFSDFSDFSDVIDFSDFSDF